MTRLVSSVDDSSAQVPLPFNFRYWATDLRMGQMVNVCSNGYVNLDGVAIVKVGGNEDSIRAAAQRFLSQQADVEPFTQEVLAGALRSIVGARMKQVDRDGRTIDRDQQTNEAPDLPLAAASYLNAVIDQLTGTTDERRDVSKPDLMTWPL